MQSALECTICFENFDTGNKKPMSLPCNHGFCLKCVKDIHKGAKIECPVCQKEHKIKLNQITVDKETLRKVGDLSKNNGKN